MKPIAWLLGVFLAGCAASGPPAPPLSHTLVLMEQDFEDKGGIFPIVGTLTFTVEPDGGATSFCRRQVFTDVERRGELSTESRWELNTKIEAWTAKAVKPPAPAAAPKPYGSLTYGDLKVTWGKGDLLDPELSDLVAFLKVQTTTISVVRRR
jgi:hypothetical protein